WVDVAPDTQGAFAMQSGLALGGGAFQVEDFPAADYGDVGNELLVSRVHFGLFARHEPAVFAADVQNGLDLPRTGDITGGGQGQQVRADDQYFFSVHLFSPFVHTICQPATAVKPA